MAKKTQLDRAIESLDKEISILQEMRHRLVAQQQQMKPRVKRPRVVAPAAERLG